VCVHFEFDLHTDPCDVIVLFVCKMSEQRCLYGCAEWLDSSWICNLHTHMDVLVWESCFLGLLDLYTGSFEENCQGQE
jgi:hypothetical protein